MRVNLFFWMVCGRFIEFMFVFKFIGKEEFILNVLKWILIVGLFEDMFGGCGCLDFKRLLCFMLFVMMRMFVKDDK